MIRRGAICFVIAGGNWVFDLRRRGDRYEDYAVHRPAGKPEQVDGTRRDRGRPWMSGDDGGFGRGAAMVQDGCADVVSDTDRYGRPSATSRDVGVDRGIGRAVGADRRHEVQDATRAWRKLMYGR